MEKTLSEYAPDIDLSKLTEAQLAQLTEQAGAAENVWSKRNKPSFTHLAVAMTIRGDLREILTPRVTVETPVTCVRAIGAATGISMRHEQPQQQAQASDPERVKALNDAIHREDLD